VKQQWADRLADIQPFRVMEVLSRAKALEAQGRDIVHMEIGEPDFITAAPIIAAGQQALAAGKTHYSQALGLPELRQRIADFYRDRYQLDISPERIVITPGASGALMLASALLVNPGQGLLMADPGYPCNRHFLRIVEGQGQLVPVDASDRYQLLAGNAEKHWQENTAGIIVASPANPTGEILTRDELSALSALCEQHDAVLVVDEIYHGLCYDQPAPSVLEVTDQAFVINSFSKYFGMTGWRLGWMVAPEAAVPALDKLAQNLFIAPPTVSQHAAIAAFEPETLALLEARREEFAKRRDYLLPALQQLGFDIPHAPDGAFYIYADISRFSDNSEQFCLQLLEETGVAITPGTDFGHYQANTHVRFAYTTDLERLREGMKRLTTFLSGK
jgi:aspartate/methionine/tyrosine aminotransferase